MLTEAPDASIHCLVSMSLSGGKEDKDSGPTKLSPIYTIPSKYLHTVHATALLDATTKADNRFHIDDTVAYRSGYLGEIEVSKRKGKVEELLRAVTGPNPNG